MANWGQKVYPSDYAEIKALLKAEVGRRGKTEGTARRQSVGSMASYNGSAYDFSTQPTAGAYIKNEHIQKITKPLDAIKGTSSDVYKRQKEHRPHPKMGRKSQRAG